VDPGRFTIAINSTEQIQAPRTGDVVKITPIPYARVQAIRRFVSAGPTATSNSNRGEAA
jgi:hypothetical protein